MKPYIPDNPVALEMEHRKLQALALRAATQLEIAYRNKPDLEMVQGLINDLKAAVNKDN